MAYQNGEEEQRRRDMELQNLSTQDRIRYKNLETQYDNLQETAAAPTEDKQEYILSRLFNAKKKR